jgi:hypothetical protein
LNFFAKVSFPIYFLHPFIINAVRHLNLFFPDFFSSHESILLWSLSVVLVTGSSAFVAVTIKKLLPKYSMFFIGR